MGKNNEGQDLVAKRRELVARLRLRQLSQREIVVALAAQGVVNPKTGEPFDRAQIVRDLKAIRAEWLAARNEAVDQHVARLLAEIAEVKREASKTGELRAWLAAIREEADLLGAHSPTKIEVRDWREEARENGFDDAAMFEAMVQEALRRAEAAK